MRTNQRTLALIIILLSTVIVLNGQEKDKKVETVKFRTSIDCQDCVNTIMGSLPREKGIKDVKCDLATKEVTVTFHNEKTNSEVVQRNIEKLGYSAKPVKEEKKAEAKQ